MQDLTTGSLSRHLLNTSSFMLIAMVFQTLYALIDLYCVGRLGTRCGGGSRGQRQSDVLRAGGHAYARRAVLHDRAAAMRGTGNFKAGMIAQSATIIINIVLAPIVIFAQLTISLLLLRREFRRRLVFVATDAPASAAAS